MTNAYVYVPAGLPIIVENVSCSHDTSPWVTLRGKLFIPEEHDAAEFLTSYESYPWYMQLLYWLSFGLSAFKPAPIYSFPPNINIKLSTNPNKVIVTKVIDSGKIRVPNTWIMLWEAC